MFQALHMGQLNSKSGFYFFRDVQTKQVFCVLFEIFEIQVHGFNPPFFRAIIGTDYDAPPRSGAPCVNVSIFPFRRRSRVFRASRAAFATPPPRKSL